MHLSLRLSTVRSHPCTVVSRILVLAFDAHRVHLLEVDNTLRYNYTRLRYYFVFSVLVDVAAVCSLVRRHVVVVSVVSDVVEDAPLVRANHPRVRHLSAVKLGNLSETMLTVLARDRSTLLSGKKKLLVQLLMPVEGFDVDLWSGGRLWLLSLERGHLIVDALRHHP